MHQTHFLYWPKHKLLLPIFYPNKARKKHPLWTSQLVQCWLMLLWTFALFSIKDAEVYSNLSLNRCPFIAMWVYFARPPKASIFTPLALLSLDLVSNVVHAPCLAFHNTHHAIYPSSKTLHTQSSCYPWYNAHYLQNHHSTRHNRLYQTRLCLTMGSTLIQKQIANATSNQIWNQYLHDELSSLLIVEYTQFKRHCRKNC